MPASYQELMCVKQFSGKAAVIVNVPCRTVQFSGKRHQIHTVIFFPGIDSLTATQENLN